MRLLFLVLLILSWPAALFAQTKHQEANTIAVDDPYIFAPSWTKQDEDKIIKAYINALSKEPKLLWHGRIFIWDFIDKSGELIDTEHLKQRLMDELSKAFPQKRFFFKGYASLIIHGQIEMDMKEVDGSIHKNYTIWLKAINSDIPMKQVWSKKITFTHSYLIPEYRVGIIEDAR